MEIRKLPMGQGMAWFKQSIDLGGHNPRGVFGAAALMLLALYAAGLVIVVPMVAVVPDTGGEPDVGAVLSRLWPFLVLMVLAISVLLPFLVGGLMHVIRETEAGHKPGALAVFRPFRSGKAGRLAAVGLSMLAIQVVGGALVMLTGGREYLEAYGEMVRGLLAGADPRTLPQPDTSLLMFLLQLLVNYVGYAVLLFSVPSILFLGAPVGEALGGSLKASFRNVGANLLAGVLLILAMIVATLLFLLLMMLVVLVGNAIHAIVGGLLMLVLGLLFASAVMVVLVGAAYLAWRDTFGGGAPASSPPAATHAGIEA